MTQQLPRSALELAAPVLTAFNIGTWEDEVGANRVRGDVVMARIFGLSQWDVAEGMPWQRLAEKFHPEDLASDMEERRRVRQTGGLFVWEHRVVHETGEVRWVLARGHFAPDENGMMRGRGIVIDLTDSRADDEADRSSRFFGQPDSQGSTVERMAAHVLATWELAAHLDDEATQRFKPLLEPLLYEIGRRIAAELAGNLMAEARARKADPNLH